MSDIAFVEVDDDCTTEQWSELRSELQDVAEDTGTRIVVVSGNVEGMDEKAVKETLGELVCILGYELDMVDSKDLSI